MFTPTTPNNKSKSKKFLTKSQLSSNTKIRDLCEKLFSSSTSKGLCTNPSSGKLTSAMYRLPSCKLKIVRTLKQLNKTIENSPKL